MKGLYKRGNSEYSIRQKSLRENIERDDELLGYACGILAEKHIGLNDLLNTLIEVHTAGYNAGVRANFQIMVE
jgi:hypothetical protein